MTSVGHYREQERLLLQFLVRSHGSASLEQIKQAKLVSSGLVTSVMRRLIEGKIVALHGDAIYRLVAKEKQAEPPDSPSQLGGSEPATEPVSTGVQSAVNSEPQPPEPIQKRCARCKDWKDANQFPQRDGLQRPGCLCNGCLANAPALSIIEAVEADPLNAARHSGQLSDLSPENTSAIGPALTIEITTGVHAYLVRLVGTGLWGQTIEDVAERLICRGLIVQLSSGGMLAPIGESK